MKRPQWIVRLAGNAGRRYCTPRIEIEGPAVTKLVGDAIEKLADLASYEDSLTEAWFEFVTARRAVVKGEEDLVDEATRASLLDAADDARAAVMGELATVLRLDVADARLIAAQIDEACGRVGTVAA